ncbi:IS1 family transposase [Acidovorax sp. NCPPB 4044]|uniref:IS1 family transposase n=1 Tax=Acidovorax sp. NCPPB 4044 TaxID=2940490 RepID=UPI0023043E95|nr:IS1 family transposase [Acidovorax sp. NCPPB 4044]MDA8521693.1 IS1 family transposase [Acidovorax sp. NCPPB 4044]MDA8523504.1 IS1 family transposase [Acidovorax sp. NCPPB 4044]MDA8523683.1 IS1 family transposase [Acidovorax sp. NCPPB 4044]
MTLQCPDCQHQEVRNAGTSRHGHRRWACKACGRTFGDKNYRLIDSQTRERALALYAEGMSARAIERIVGVSHNSVLNWVRKEVADQALQPIPPATQQVVEIDEMWSYAGSKKDPSGSGGP